MVQQTKRKHHKKTGGISFFGLNKPKIELTSQQKSENASAQIKSMMSKQRLNDLYILVNIVTYDAYTVDPNRIGSNSHLFKEEIKSVLDDLNFSINQYTTLFNNLFRSKSFSRDMLTTSFIDKQPGVIQEVAQPESKNVTESELKDVLVENKNELDNIVNQTGGGLFDWFSSSSSSSNSNQQPTVQQSTVQQPQSVQISPTPPSDSESTPLLQAETALTEPLDFQKELDSLLELFRTKEFKIQSEFTNSEFMDVYNQNNRELNYFLRVICILIKLADVFQNEYNKKGETTREQQKLMLNGKVMITKSKMFGEFKNLLNVATLGTSALLMDREGRQKRRDIRNSNVDLKSFRGGEGETNSSSLPKAQQTNSSSLQTAKNMVFRTIQFFKASPPNVKEKYFYLFYMQQMTIMFKDNMFKDYVKNNQIKNEKITYKSMFYNIISAPWRVGVKNQKLGAIFATLTLATNIVFYTAIAVPPLAPVAGAMVMAHKIVSIGMVPFIDPPRVDLYREAELDLATEEHEFHHVNHSGVVEDIRKKFTELLMSIYSSDQVVVGFESTATSDNPMVIQQQLPQPLEQQQPLPSTVDEEYKKRVAAATALVKPRSTLSQRFLPKAVNSFSDTLRNMWYRGGHKKSLRRKTFIKKRKTLNKRKNRRNRIE